MILSAFVPAEWLFREDVNAAPKAAAGAGDAAAAGGAAAAAAAAGTVAAGHAGPPLHRQHQFVGEIVGKWASHEVGRLVEHVTWRRSVMDDDENDDEKDESPAGGETRPISWLNPSTFS
jgi:hypothetical protein